jgi:hypothetical protein
VKEESLTSTTSGGLGAELVAVGEEAQLAALAVLMENVDGALPGIEPDGVEFAQMEHLALDHAVAADAQAFTDRKAGWVLPALARMRPASGQVGPRAF